MKQFLVGGCAALLVLAGCAEDPSLYLGGPPGPATRLQISNGNLSLMVGDQITVGAAALDAVGNVTADVPTFTPCSGVPATVATATGEALYSGAARIQAAASTVGAGCITVAAGGVSDTIHVEVGPAGVTIVGSDTVGSGESVNYTVAGFDRAGAAVTGTAPYQWASSNKARMTADISMGIATGRSPGAVTLQVRGPGGGNSARSLTVAPGAFAGTLSANTGGAGLVVTATGGAGDDAFDANTAVTYGGVTPYLETVSGTVLRVALPTTGVAGAQLLTFLNLGPGETAKQVTVTASSAFDDRFGATTDGSGTAPTYNSVASPANWVYFSHAGFGTGSAARGIQNGGAQQDHYFLVTAGAAGATLSEIRLEWLGGTTGDDFDLIICDTATETDCAVGFSGATTSEVVTNVVLAANTTYYIAASCWLAANNIRNLRLRVTGTGFN